ncbi:hypothetical protein ABZ357_17415 [Streptomyces sp. NPDC005917]|uniref:hypothetical protein n=1 Tax=unclassified Streptomyces TaxID=2593676 RepID=UPI0033CCAAE0
MLEGCSCSPLVAGQVPSAVPAPLETARGAWMVAGACPPVVVPQVTETVTVAPGRAPPGFASAAGPATAAVPATPNAAPVRTATDRTRAVRRMG